LAVLMLEQAGHAIDVVEDGAAAIEAVHDRQLGPGADGQADASGRPRGRAESPRPSPALHVALTADARLG